MCDKLNLYNIGMIELESFYKRLENLREKHNLTKKEVSLRLGFTPNVYGAYERGDRSPSLETLVKLADMYNVSLDYIIREDADEYGAKVDFAEEIMKILEKYDVSDFSLLDLEKWKTLSKNDILLINHHFKWLVEKAKSTDS